MNAIYEITRQQLENVLNEVENQTECWITKKMVVMLKSVNLNYSVSLTISVILNFFLPQVKQIKV